MVPPSKISLGVRTQGFTLIEMLVSLAILAVLIALIGSVATHVQQQGKIAKSTSNLQQLGTLTSVYAAENEGRLPVYDFNNLKYNWVASLYTTAYHEAFPWFLPWETGENLKGTLFYSPMLTSDEGTPLRSYGISSGIRNAEVSPTQDNRIAMVNITEPSRTLLYADALHSSAVGKPADLAYRNKGKAILCFVDGHIEMREQSEVPERGSAEWAVFWHR